VFCFKARKGRKESIACLAKYVKTNHHELKISSTNKKPSENWAARHQLGE